MSITDQQLSDLAYAASMYAIGRQTGIVESVAIAVLASLPQCTCNDRRVIADRADAWLNATGEYKMYTKPLESEWALWQKVIDEARQLNKKEAPHDAP